MSPRSGPDVYDERVFSFVLCPLCKHKTHYALNTDRYVCDIHGPVTTAEATWPKGTRS